MKKSIVLAVLLTLAAFVSGAIAAAPPKAAGTAPAPAAPVSTKPAKVEKFPGEIKSVDAMGKSIVVAQGKEEKTFAIDDKIKITKGKKEALKLEDLKAGMNVIIEYKKDGEKNIAKAIRVSHPRAAPKKN